MSTEKYLVINNHGLDVEYIIECHDKRYTLRRSNSSMWSEETHYSKILSITDTGEGYKIDWEEKPARVMDYSSAAELTLLLNFLDKKDTNSLQYHMVNVINLHQLL